MSLPIQLEKLKPSSAITFVFVVSTISCGFATIHVFSPNFFIELAIIKLTFLSIAVVLPLLCVNAAIIILASKRAWFSYQLKKRAVEEGYVIPESGKELLNEIDLNQIIIVSAVMTNFTICSPLLMKLVGPAKNEYLILGMAILEVFTIIAIHFMYNRKHDSK